MTKESNLQENIAILNVHTATKELQNTHRDYGQDCISKIVIIGDGTGRNIRELGDFLN